MSDVHLTLPEQFNFTRDVVEPLAADPHRRALTHVDAEGVLQRLTFAQVAESAARWAHLLRGGGLQLGDRVLVMVGKVPDWLGVMLGSIKGGLIAVPCSEMLRARDLAYRARHCEASLVVADRSAQAEIDAMRGELDRPIDVLYLDDAELLLKRHRSVAPTEDTRWYDTALLLYTSGTTGHAKGVTHTHGYTFSKRMQAEHWLTARPGDLVWCTAGTGWAKSIWNVLLGPWSRGAEIVMHQGGFDPAERFDLVDALGVTILCQSPTEYRLMSKSDALGAIPLSRLRHAVSAGEPLNPEVIERFRDALGVTVYDGYGQTETTLLVANSRDSDVRPGSMGVPTPGHRVCVIDEEGNEVGAGAEGDIALHGRPPSLFSGYWEDREATQAVFRGDWYVTGDRAVRDEDGYFWFTGRADDVITSAAYRIGPFEVESALLEHPAVAESAVVGKPDPDRGQIVKAFVVLRPGYERSAELVTELQEHAKRVTAPYKYPREIEFVDDLPKTRSGKIRRVELRQREAASPEAAPAAVIAVAAPAPAAEERRRQEAELAAAEERMRREAEARAARELEEREAARHAPTDMEAPATAVAEPVVEPAAEEAAEGAPEEAHATEAEETADVADEPAPEPSPSPPPTTDEADEADEAHMTLRERLERYAMRPPDPRADDE